MAQTGFTPISIYYSSTATNVPTAGNLVAGELAINTADGKLFYKDSAGVVQVIAGKGGAGVAGGSTTQVQYNSSGSLAGSANFVFDGTNVVVSSAIGVGVTAPRGKLNIEGSSTTTLNTTACWEYIGNGGAASYTFNNYMGIGFGYNNSGNAEAPAFIGFQVTDGAASTNGALVFATRSVTSATAPTERMRINSTGSVGIGVTPNTWGNGNAVQLLGGSLWSYSNAYVDVLANSYWDGSVYKYVSNNPVSQFRQFGGQFIWNSAPTGTAGNTVSLVETMRLNTTGNLSLKGGTTTADGTGITFPATQSASSDANCLDDYEEGTFTPTISGATTYGFQVGRYTKIGNLVTYVISVNCARTASAAGFRISGLPFTSTNVGNLYSVPAIFPILGFNKSGASFYAAQLPWNTTYFDMYGTQTASGANFLQMTMNDTGPTVEVEMTGQYYTS